MIKLRLNGKPFNPKTFQDTIMKQVMEEAAEQLREKVSAIRHPETGEFPTIVVTATSLDDMKLHIEGSPELLALVNKRLGINEEEIEGSDLPTETSVPKVFLSYTWDDTDLAKQIAETLMANGIDTWWDKWCISAGDSFRQKIDEGLEGCTHFLVLLTPNSLSKPWVNQEMDAGLMRKLNAKSKFIPVRYQVSPAQLPALLTGMLSPEIVNPEADIQQLINDIHGISKKPSLGSMPAAAYNSVQKTGYSPAANTIAKIFVEDSKTARKFDPQMSLARLIELTGLTKDDVVDAIHELSGMVTMRFEDLIYPENRLFTTFDSFWMDWVPADDALKLAADMLNDSNFPTNPAEVAKRYQWSQRRLNPAIAYLADRNLIKSLATVASGNWVSACILKNDETRRFVKSRS